MLMDELNEKVMAVVSTFEEDVLRLICRYTLQSGRCLEEKEFLMTLKMSGTYIVYMILLCSWRILMDMWVMNFIMYRLWCRSKINQSIKVYSAFKQTIIIYNIWKAEC